jgi:hypothetical protein
MSNKFTPILTLMIALARFWENPYPELATAGYYSRHPPQKFAFYAARSAELPSNPTDMSTRVRAIPLSTGLSSALENENPALKFLTVRILWPRMYRATRDALKPFRNDPRCENLGGQIQARPLPRKNISQGDSSLLRKIRHCGARFLSLLKLAPMLLW